MFEMWLVFLYQWKWVRICWAADPHGKSHRLRKHIRTPTNRIPPDWSGPPPPGSSIGEYVMQIQRDKRSRSRRRSGPNLKDRKYKLSKYIWRRKVQLNFLKINKISLSWSVLVIIDTISWFTWWFLKLPRWSGWGQGQGQGHGAKEKGDPRQNHGLGFKWRG